MSQRNGVKRGRMHGVRESRRKGSMRRALQSNTSPVRLKQHTILRSKTRAACKRIRYRSTLWRCVETLTKRLGTLKRRAPISSDSCRWRGTPRRQQDRVAEPTQPRFSMDKSRFWPCRGILSASSHRRAHPRRTCHPGAKSESSGQLVC